MDGNRRIVSPNGKHTAFLTCCGEIRFGPEYFHLAVDERDFRERVFGHLVLWSPDSQIACVQEWHTLDYVRGPVTSLLLIRPGDGTFFRFPQVKKGFASPDHFVNSTLVLRHFDRHVGGVQARVDLETDLAGIREWEPL